MDFRVGVQRPPPPPPWWDTAAFARRNRKPSPSPPPPHKRPAAVVLSMAEQRLSTVERARACEELLVTMHDCEGPSYVPGTAGHGAFHWLCAIALTHDPDKCWGCPCHQPKLHEQLASMGCQERPHEEGGGGGCQPSPDQPVEHWSRPPPAPAAPPSPAPLTPQLQSAELPLWSWPPPTPPAASAVAAAAAAARGGLASLASSSKPPSRVASELAQLVRNLLGSYGRPTLGVLLVGILMVACVCTGLASAFRQPHRKYDRAARFGADDFRGYEDEEDEQDELEDETLVSARRAMRSHREDERARHGTGVSGRQMQRSPTREKLQHERRVPSFRDPCGWAARGEAMGSYHTVAMQAEHSSHLMHPHHSPQQQAWGEAADLELQGARMTMPPHYCHPHEGGPGGEPCYSHPYHIEPQYGAAAYAPPEHAAAGPAWYSYGEPQYQDGYDVRCDGPLYGHGGAPGHTTHAFPQQHYPQEQQHASRCFGYSHGGAAGARDAPRGWWQGVTTGWGRMHGRARSSRGQPSFEEAQPFARGSYAEEGRQEVEADEPSSPLMRHDPTEHKSMIGGPTLRERRAAFEATRDARGSSIDGRKRALQARQRMLAVAPGTSSDKAEPAEAEATSRYAADDCTETVVTADESGTVLRADDGGGGGDDSAASGQAPAKESSYGEVSFEQRKEVIAKLMAGRQRQQKQQQHEQHEQATDPAAARPARARMPAASRSGWSTVGEV